MVIRDICHTLGVPMSNVNGSNSDGVRVMDCKRDNIDVATLVMESEDSRRSLVRNFTDKSGVLRFFLIWHEFYSPFFSCNVVTLPSNTLNNYDDNSCTRSSKMRSRTSKFRVMIVLT